MSFPAHLSRNSVRASLLLLATCLGSPASAQPTAVALVCGQGVLVTSNGAGLRELLQEMATSLKFDLQYWSDDNPGIRVKGRHAALDLVQLLSQDANLLVRYRTDRFCKGELKIASIWVVSPSAAEGGATRAPAVRLAPPVAAAAAVAVPANTSGEGNQEHLRAHGLLPEPARP